MICCTLLYYTIAFCRCDLFDCHCYTVTRWPPRSTGPRLLWFNAQFCVFGHGTRDPQFEALRIVIIRIDRTKLVGHLDLQGLGQASDI